MSLLDHLRELRNRLIKSAIVIVLLAAIAFFLLYGWLFDLLVAPFESIVDQATAEGREITLALLDVMGALNLQMKVCFAFGLIAGSPVWLFQLWRFLAPGLKKKEKKWAYIFSFIAAPLFVAGVAMGYFVLPHVLEVLLGLTPEGVDNVIQVDYYLSFFLQLLIFFGIGFLIPLTFVMLNFAGILSGRRLLSWWRGLLFGAFVFAAVATPTGDPISMLLIALPMILLFTVAIVLSLINDKRRNKKAGEEFGDVADTDTSQLNYTPEPIQAPEPVQPATALDPVTDEHNRPDTT